MSRWVSARTRFVVSSAIRREIASRKSRSASAWCWSRRLRSAIQAPLSTNSRAGPAARAIRCPRLGNERFVEIAVEVLAQIGGQPVDVAAELEQRVLGRPARERSDGGADGLRLGPSAFPGPCLEALEVTLVEVNLQRPHHDSNAIGSCSRSQLDHELGPAAGLA